MLPPSRSRDAQGVEAIRAKVTRFGGAFLVGNFVGELTTVIHAGAEVGLVVEVDLDHPDQHFGAPD